MSIKHSQSYYCNVAFLIFIHSQFPMFLLFPFIFLHSFLFSSFLSFSPVSVCLFLSLLCFPLLLSRFCLSLFLSLFCLSFIFLSISFLPVFLYVCLSVFLFIPFFSFFLYRFCLSFLSRPCSERDTVRTMSMQQIKARCPFRYSLTAVSLEILGGGSGGARHQRNARIISLCVHSDMKKTASSDSVK